MATIERKASIREVSLPPLVFHGSFLGRDHQMTLITRGQWDMIPEDAKPSAMREKSGELYAVFMAAASAASESASPSASR